MHICVHIYIHIHVHMQIHVECTRPRPCPCRRLDRCRPTGKTRFFIDFVCFLVLSKLVCARSLHFACILRNTFCSMKTRLWFSLFILNSDLMIDMLPRKAKGRIAALQRVNRLLSSDNLRTIYAMFIRSIMEYGSVAWCGAAVSHLKNNWRFWSWQSGC